MKVYFFEKKSKTTIQKEVSCSMPTLYNNFYEHRRYHNDNYGKVLPIPTRIHRELFMIAFCSLLEHKKIIFAKNHTNSFSMSIPPDDHIMINHVICNSCRRFIVWQQVTVHTFMSLCRMCKITQESYHIWLVRRSVMAFETSGGQRTGLLGNIIFKSILFNSNIISFDFWQHDRQAVRSNIMNSFN